MPRFFRLLFPLVIILVHNVAFAAGFIGAAVYPVTQTPVAALTADFNRDGHLDIATADSVGNNVSVLLGNANGTFGVSTQYASGPCTAIASGDFNGDGNPDLAAVAGAYGLIVLIGKSDGTFVAAAAILFGIKPDGVVVADINGDGKRDLLVSDYGLYASRKKTGSVYVLLGNGDGTFQTATLFTAGFTNPVGLTVADLNRDGKLDVVTANDNTTISNNSNTVLLGNGDGTLQAPLAVNGAGRTATWVEAADVNGDGIPDLAVANVSNSVSILIGNGDATFQAPTSYAVSGSADKLTLADLSDDGVPDLLVAGDSGLHVLKGNAGGTFQKEVLWGVGIHFVVVGMFNGDTALDVAGAGFTAVNVALGNGDGTLQAPRGFFVNSLIAGVATGDFNGDHKADLAIIRQTNGNSLTILLGMGNGSFQPPKRSTPVSSARSIVTGDFNGDSKLDLSIGYEANGGLSGAIQILLGNGDGTFQTGQAYTTGSIPDNQVAGDFNHDGHMDLAVANTFDGDVSVLLGNGDGTLQPAVNYSVGNFLLSIETADFNGDGKLDLVVSADRFLKLLPGKGDGTFRPAVTISAPAGSLALGDFNRDGKLDVVSSVSTSTSLVAGNGNGTFQAPVQVLNVGGLVRGVDVNGDGKLDLVISGDPGVEFAVGNGNGNFRAPTPYFAGVFNGWFDVGNFNSDNAPDLAVADTNSEVYILLNNRQP